MKDTICQCWDDEIPQYQKEGRAHCSHCKLPITTTKEQQTQEKEEENIPLNGWNDYRHRSSGTTGGVKLMKFMGYEPSEASPEQTQEPKGETADNYDEPMMDKIDFVLLDLADRVINLNKASDRIRVIVHEAHQSSTPNYYEKHGKLAEDYADLYNKYQELKTSTPNKGLTAEDIDRLYKKYWEPDTVVEGDRYRMPVFRDWLKQQASPKEGLTVEQVDKILEQLNDYCINHIDSHHYGLPLYGSAIKELREIVMQFSSVLHQGEREQNKGLTAEEVEKMVDEITYRYDDYTGGNYCYPDKVKDLIKSIFTLQEEHQGERKQKGGID